MITKILHSVLAVFVLSVCTVVLLPGTSMGEEDCFFLGRITQEPAEIRSGYNKNFNCVLSLKKDDLVIVCGKNFLWYKIMLPARADCYVHADFIERRSGTTGLVKPNRLNVRGGPDTKFGVLGQLKRGEEVVIKERIGKWYSIFPTDDTYGWICQDCLEEAGSAEDFLEERKFLEACEKKFKELELDYQRALSGRNHSPSLECVLEGFSSLQTECADYEDIVARIREKKDIITRKIEGGDFVEKNPEVKKQKLIEVSGQIQDLGKFFGRRGTHRLIKDSKTVFYLESEDVDLDVFSGCPVKIWGVVEEDTEENQTVLRVERLTFQ